VIGAAIIFLSLGLDTLAVSLGLGMAGLPRQRWVRVGLTFACFEGLMPIIGLLIGHQLGSLLGEVAAYIAGGILVIVGGLEIREAVFEKDADDRDDLPATVPTEEKQHPLILTGLSVSLDELAVGFALGVLDVPVGLALGYIAVQAFVLTFIGLQLGRRLGHHLGEHAELAAGIVLALLGVALAINEITGSHFL
jgi:putative Mn2+ efflux pump MntP